MSTHRMCSCAGRRACLCKMKSDGGLLESVYRGACSGSRGDNVYGGSDGGCDVSAALGMWW